MTATLEAALRALRAEGAARHAPPRTATRAATTSPKSNRHEPNNDKTPCRRRDMKLGPTPSGGQRRHYAACAEPGCLAAISSPYRESRDQWVTDHAKHTGHISFDVQEA